MTLEIRYVDPKTGELLASVPNRVADHTYLEYRFAQAKAARELPQDLGLYVAKLYEGVSEVDLHYLRQEHSLYAIGSNRRSAYFVDDPAVAQWVRQQIFTNQSDPVAYFSVVMSPAIASTVVPEARVLVIDDGVPAEASAAKKWGRRKPKDRAGKTINPELLEQAHRLLGDGYCLVAPNLHRQVSREPALEAAHQAAEEERLSLVQQFAVAGDEVGYWKAGAVVPVLQFYLEEAIRRALSNDLDLDSQALADLRLPLQVMDLKLGQDGIRGEVATARWRYTDLENDRTYTGRVLLERREGKGSQMDLTFVGGTQAQKQAVDEAFAAIAVSDLTPCQLRGGVSEWKGAFKGTARAASICKQLGVDAVLPRSAIKADGKTVPLGISEVKELFWARKSNARASQQRLGTQALGNLPQGTEADVLPKLAQRQAELAEAMSDPRRLADLYCEAYERRQQRKAELQPDDLGSVKTKQARADWLYRIRA